MPNKVNKYQINMKKMWKNIFSIFYVWAKNKQVKQKKKKSKMLKNEQMGSGGCKPKKMVWKAK